MRPNDQRVSVALPDDAGEVIAFRRPKREEVDLDITPMIDVTFLLLIFFLVSATVETAKAVDLPPAKFGKGVGVQGSLVITVADRGLTVPPAVYLADGKVGEPLPDDPDTQRDMIRQAVTEALQTGKSNVLIKAERSLRHREVARIMEDAAQVEGVKLYIGVLERD